MIYSSMDHEIINQGPGWVDLQESITNISMNFNILCEALKMIVNIENSKLITTGLADIPQSCKRTLKQEQMFVGELQSKLKNYETVELRGDVEYARLYRILMKELNKNVEGLQVSLQRQLKRKTIAMVSLIEENERTMQMSKVNEDNLHKEKLKHEETKSLNKILTARDKTLQEQLENKSHEIARLKRESNKTLWEREKQNVINEIDSKEEHLKSELQNKNDQFEKSIDRLRKTVQLKQDEIHMLKARRAITGKHRANQSENEKLKRLLFVKERMFIVAEGEIRKQQQYYYGFLYGLHKDYQIALSKRNSESLTDNERDLKQIMTKILNAVDKGSVSSLRESLPLHYRRNETKLRGRLLTQLSKEALDFDYSDIDLDAIKVSSTLYKWRNSEYFSPSLGKLLKDRKKEHPKLILRNGTLMKKETQTYFPNFTEDKIQTLFQTFKTIDTKGDLTLDTKEILASLNKSNLGTVEDVTDAIKEIDLSGSGNVDFFEFLLLAQLLSHDECESSLYQNKKVVEVMTRDKNAKSTACTIQ